MGLIRDNKRLQHKYKHDREPMSMDRLAFRMVLLEEEFREAADAYKKLDAEEFVDANIDIIVIALGNLILSGVEVQKAWDTVHKSNMTKVVGVNAKRPNSGGFDITKPEGWKKPSHKGNHGTLGELFNKMKKQ
jgi:predicted HAD superfamily Cof-like phosphohydrolase